MRISSHDYTRPSRPSMLSRRCCSMLTPRWRSPCGSTQYPDPDGGMCRSVRDVAAGRTPNGRGRPRADWRDGSAKTFGIDTLCIRATLRAARSEARKLPSVGPEAERRGGRVGAAASSSTDDAAVTGGGG